MCAYALIEPWRPKTNHRALTVEAPAEPSLPELFWFPPDCSPPGGTRCGVGHAILGLQAQMKAEAVDRNHGRLLRLNAGKHPGKQNERIFVVSIHVLHDPSGSVSQRV